MEYENKVTITEEFNHNSRLWADNTDNFFKRELCLKLVQEKL